MNTSIWTRSLVFALAGCTVAALAAPAAGSGGGDITLHRDGSKAVPFVANVDKPPVLHRDGSKAVPFVANVESSSPTADTGFDWGDAAIGAGFALALVGVGALLVESGRRRVGRRQAAKRQVSAA